MPNREPQSASLQTANPLVKAIPSLLVLVVVMILLRGFSGAATALRLQAATFVSSFFGGGDEFIRVLLHTTPLALAAGVATFAIASRWIRFESLWSFVILAGIVLGGATVGGTLRRLAPVPGREAVQAGASAQSQPAGRSPQVRPLRIPASQVGVIGGGVAASNRLREPLSPDALNTGPVDNNAANDNAVDTGVPADSAWDQLAKIDWLAEPNLKNAPPDHIAPLNLFPRVGGLPGAVLLAINQLLGFLVAYQPRLFAAAILSGGWLGWLWQRRLVAWNKTMRDMVEESETAAEDELRRAA